MSENIGYATLSVIPSALGFGASLSKGIAPQMAAAGASGGAGLLGAIKKALPVAAVLAAVGTLAAIGSTFHEMTSIIRVGTGATGSALDSLVASAKNVGQKVPSSFADIGKTVTALNVRLGLTGPVLETLTRQFLVAGRITKQALDLNTVTGSFNAFGISSANMSGALDQLFQISQATGMGINELAAAATKGAPAFRQFGLSFADSAALVGVLDKAGINSGKTIMALTIGLTKFSKAGKAPGPALRETVKSIEAFTKSGQDAKAIALAAGIFGTRGAAQFVAAVKSGKVNLDDMMKASGASSDTILKAGSAVSTFASKWLVFKNNVLLAVEPIATRVFKAFGDGMQFMNDTGIPALQKFGAALSVKVGPALAAFGVFVTGTVVPGVQALIAAFQAGGSDVTSSGFAGGMERIGLAARGVSDWITGTGLPALASIASWITDTGIPALSSFKDWVGKSETALKTVATLITVVMLPIFLDLGVKAVASAVTQVTAWVSAQAAGATSAVSQLASHYVIVGGWVASAASAVASGATTVAIWALYAAEGIAGAAKTVASLAVVAAGWVATAAAATASAAEMAAAWIVGLGPVAWVIAAIVAVVAAIVLVANKTTWFQTIWEYTWGAIKVAFTATVNHFKAQFTDFVNVFGPLQDKIKGAFSGAGSWLYNAGKAIITGFWNGLKDQWSAVTGWISDIGSWISKHKGPLSYDRRLLVPAGTAIMGGFNKSLTDGFAKVKSNISGMSGDISSLVATPNIASPDLGSGAYANGRQSLGNSLGAFDYDRFAAAMSRVSVQSYLDGKNVTASVDQRIGGMMR